jgi:hypothetical protein
MQAASPSACAMAQAVMRGSCERLQPVLSELLSAGDAIPDGLFADRRVVHDIVYELHLVHAGLLLYLMPTVCRDLNVGAPAGGGAGGGPAGGGCGEFARLRLWLWLWLCVHPCVAWHLSAASAFLCVCLRACMHSLVVCLRACAVRLCSLLACAIHVARTRATCVRPRLLAPPLRPRTGRGRGPAA